MGLPEVGDRLFPKFEKTLPSLQGEGDVPAKIVVITGTTSGTGYQAALTCAKLGASVVLLNRPSERATASLEALRKSCPDATFDPVDCDLASLKSVEAAAEAIKAKYDAIYCLANNAGVMALADQATEDGYDIQMQVNHLSAFRLTSLLFPLLEAGGERWGEARVVMHSSIARRGGPLREKYFGKNGGNLGGDGTSMTGGRFKRYHQTKLANAVFMAALADRLDKKKSKVISVMCHPGASTTNLATSITDAGGFNFSSLLNPVIRAVVQSQADGSMGLLQCIAGSDVKNRQFYGPRGPFGMKGLASRGAAKLLPNEELYDNPTDKALLWRVSEAEVGLFGNDLA
mmetsp:Transcript_16318/g.29843  ORF Transcript_16318/g.29843 Transcript_16318/m.29843 type:complete len:344 (-) Transcript_16318:290-1321(-)